MHNEKKAVDNDEVREFIKLLKKLNPIQQAGFAMIADGAAVIAAGKKKTAN